jgi:hypothetical protein
MGESSLSGVRSSRLSPTIRPRTVEPSRISQQATLSLAWLTPHIRAVRHISVTLGSGGNLGNHD